MCICALFCGLVPCPFEPPELRAFRERYELGEQIGRGASGVTRLCVDKVTGEELACKVIRKKVPLRDVVHEARIMERLSGHPSIIGFRAAYGGDEDDRHVKYLVMELCRGGSLFKKGIVYTESQAARMMMNLMEAIHFCHSEGIVHRDITLKNILLVDENDLGSVKLADFGLAAHLHPDGYLSELIGTLHYLAPEVLKREYSKEVDVWSSGVVLYGILSGSYPFFGNTVKATLHAIESSDSPLQFHREYWKHASASVKDLIRGMLERDPIKRLTPEQVLDHEWIREKARDEKVCSGEGCVTSNCKLLNNHSMCSNSESIQRCFSSQRRELDYTFSCSSKLHRVAEDFVVLLKLLSRLLVPL